jgi:hypothetical protein
MRKFCAFVWLLIPLALFSQTIVSTQVSGLKRTKPFIADNALEKFIGRDAKDIDFNDVRAAILDTGVLDPISVKVLEGEGGAVLSVAVAEKWSFIPMPMVMANNGGSSYGLFLADLNAFGLKDQAAVGGMFGSVGKMGLLAYRMTPDKTGIPGGSLMFVFQDRERVFEDHKENTVLTFDSVEVTASLGIDHPITDKVQASFHVIFANNYTDGPSAPEGNRTLGFSPGISYRRSKWDGYLMSEYSANFSYTYNLALKNDSYHEIEGRIKAESPIVPGFLIKALGGFVFRPGAPLVAESLPRPARGEILPSKYAALHYMGLSMGFEKYVLQTRYGTISLFADWEMVISAHSGGLSNLTEENFDQGPVGGLHFYLSKLAIPAMGLSAAYNTATGKPQFAFNLGVSF